MIALLKRLLGRQDRDEIKQETQQAPALTGIRGGVFLREPNGSAHPIQNLVEQALVEQGMTLFNLRREPVERLLKTGEWSEAIAGGNLLNLAVIGQVIVRQVEAVRTEYPSRRHIHTATGGFFSDLSADHPDYQPPNAWFNGLGFLPLGTYLINPYEWRQVYHEPEIMFNARCEAEKRCTAIRVDQYTLDVRFHGPGGQIHGSVVASSRLEDNDPGDTLANWLVGELGKVAKRSLAAHSRSQAEIELFGPNYLP